MEAVVVEAVAVMVAMSSALTLPLYLPKCNILTNAIGGGFANDFHCFRIPQDSFVSRDCEPVEVSEPS